MYRYLNMIQDCLSLREHTVCNVLRGADCRLAETYDVEAYRRAC